MSCVLTRVLHQLIPELSRPLCALGIGVQRGLALLGEYAVLPIQGHVHVPAVPGNELRRLAFGVIVVRLHTDLNGRVHGIAEAYQRAGFKVIPG